MRFNKQTVLGLALAAASAAASAQMYGVVSVGASRINVDCTGLTSCDKSDTAFKIMGGYKFAPNWAGELGYFDFGKVKGTGTGETGTITGELRTTAWGGGVAFHQDLAPDWNFVGRLGVAQVKTKISGTGTIGGLAGSGSNSENHTQPYVGLGIGYKLSKTMSIDAAWDYTRTKHKAADVSGNVNAFSVGMTFGF